MSWRPVLELGPQLQRALGPVLRSGPLRDVRGLPVRAAHDPDGPHLDQGDVVPSLLRGLCCPILPPRGDAGDTILGCRLKIGPNTHLLVLTGAGVSAESGVPTFRGGGGLWENHPVEQVASPEGFQQDPAHGLALLLPEEKPAGRGRAEPRAPRPRRRRRGAWATATSSSPRTWTGCTARPGASASSRSTATSSSRSATRATARPSPTRRPTRTVPRCDQCGRGRLRPAVVWFGEMLDSANLGRIESFMRRARRRETGSSWRSAPRARSTPRRASCSRRAAPGPRPGSSTSSRRTTARPSSSFVQGPSGEVLPGLFEWD